MIKPSDKLGSSFFLYAKEHWEKKKEIGPYAICASLVLLAKHGC